jgi:hypothetical protein
VDGEESRKFGSWRPTHVLAGQRVLELIATRISSVEKHNIVGEIALLQQRCHVNPSLPGSGEDAHQSPGFLHPGPVAFTGVTKAELKGIRDEAKGRTNGVGYIHQIYGLFGDDKPMSVLFQNSQTRWKAVAQGMGIPYHMWTAKEVEALIQRVYPDHWDMYTTVRYPVMRADMARLLILHAYGGLYADLDTFPTRAWYKQSSLAVTRIDFSNRPAGKTTKVGFFL